MLPANEAAAYLVPMGIAFLSPTMSRDEAVCVRLSRCGHPHRVRSTFHLQSLSAMRIREVARYHGNLSLSRSNLPIFEA